MPDVVNPQPFVVQGQMRLAEGKPLAGKTVAAADLGEIVMRRMARDNVRND